MTAWLLVLLAGLGAYAMRGAVVLAADRWTLPDDVRHVLALSAPAVLAALVAGVFVHAGDRADALALVAGLTITWAVTWRTGRAPLAIVAGIVVAVTAASVL